MFPTHEILNKFKLFWQYPVITEKTFYLQNKDNSHFLGFPWATIFDKKYNLQVIFNILKQYIDSSKTYYSCCQHIHFKYFLGLWSALKIKTVYISHKVKGEDNINGISLKPCPLYALNIEDPVISKDFENIDLLNVERPILYNFIGGYQPNYLTQIRPNIFKMKHPENTVIKNTGIWHLDKLVYNEKQNIKQELNLNEDHNNKTKYYNELLIKSRYTLAPSGSGPNSIRFWEALGAGSIPILFADTLELPEHSLWNDAVIFMKESDITSLPEKLANISKDKERKMRENCLKIYNDLKNNYVSINYSKKLNKNINHCLIIVGQLRTLVYEKVKLRLKNIIDNYNGDVFFLIEDDEISKKFDYSIFNPKDILFYKYKGPVRSFGYLMVYGWSKCMEIILKHEKINNKKYDLIFKSRPDLYLYHDLPKNLNEYNIDYSKAMVWGETIGGYNTEIFRAINLPNNMKNIVIQANNYEENIIKNNKFYNSITIKNEKRRTNGFALKDTFNVMTRKACKIFFQDFYDEFCKNPIDPLFNMYGPEGKLGLFLFKSNVEKRIVHMNRLIVREDTSEFCNISKDNLIMDL